MPPQNTGVAAYDLLYRDFGLYINPENKIASLVEADFRERDAAGAKKYGTRLGLNDGRDPLLDPYQEAMDLTVYLAKAYTLKHATYNLLTSVERRLFEQALEIVLQLRLLIYERDGR